jgi:hypothetical protein
MAKGAATENVLGGLHSLLAKVFKRTLDKYLAQLDAIDNLNHDELEGEMVLALLNEVGEPNPAMLSAISKFLKDNDIGMDSDEVEALNSTERRLATRREARRKAGLMDLKVVPLVEQSYGTS